jgi:polyisoprenoid-binding protein YceI
MRRHWVMGVGMAMGLALALPATAGAQAAAATKVPAGATRWQVDPNHSDLSFYIRHLAGRVRGSIAVWQGEIVADLGNLATGSVDIFAYPGTIDTGNRDRDDHLRSDDFFDVANYPTIRFTSTEVKANGSALTITGDLTVKGVTKRVTLAGKLSGITKKDMSGKARVGFQASTTINRKDFGLTWNKMVEGTTMLGDDVEVEIAVEAVEWKGKK